LFKSIDGVPQLIIKRPHVNLKVLIDLGNREQAKEVVVESLFESDTIEYLIGKIQAQAPHIITSPAMV
jgi:hypothetical protein